MAKGNMGNLLQHFVALRVAQRLVDAWQRPDTSIEYIDCYSMAPWEPITGRQPQGFVERINSFPDKLAGGDLVASVFLGAWQKEFGDGVLALHPLDRQYPNTAVLLRTAFPEQHWQMRLHEDDSTNAGKRDRLSKWAGKQPNGKYEVESNWQSSKLICNSPALIDRPTFVMLDPFQVVEDKNPNADKGGYLSSRLLRFLCGRHALDIGSRRVESDRPIPLVFTLFSYSDLTPDKSEAVVRERFNGGDWFVDPVRSGPWQAPGGGVGWHQGWIASTGISAPILGMPVQDAWDAWNQ